MGVVGEIVWLVQNHEDPIPQTWMLVNPQAVQNQTPRHEHSSCHNQTTVTTPETDRSDTVIRALCMVSSVSRWS